MDQFVVQLGELPTSRCKDRHDDGRGHCRDQDADTDPAKDYASSGHATTALQTVRLIDLPSGHVSEYQSKDGTKEIDPHDAKHKGCDGKAVCP